MDKITRADLPAFLESAAKMMAEKSEELGEMDARLGDGDLGLTMKKGFGALPEIAQGQTEPDLGKALAKTAMKMSSIIPSTMGFLMSSGLMSGGKAIAGCDAMGAKEYAAFLRGYCNGIITRGKCAPGDRTVLDAMDGAANAAEALLKDKPEASLSEVAEAAQKGAEAGTEATKDMEPKYGKAAVHKDAAKGIPDQGACAGLYLVTAFRQFIDG